MENLSIPSWFYKENDSKNIWKLRIDNSLRKDEIDTLEKGLKDGWKETKVQQYLKTKPYLFDGLCRHGHGTFVYYEQSFGGKYFTDWIIGSGHSGGLMWDLIELECPQSKPFIKDGHYSDSTRKGINQIDDWRLWLAANINMVQRPISENGLGLYDLNSHAFGIVVVGRRELYQSLDGNSMYNKLRTSTKSQNNIEVISYESLIERMRFRISA